jgi:hypothetical protein
MGDAQNERNVRFGDVVVTGFFWGGGVGKVISTFAVELLRPGSQRDIETFVCRVVGFRTGWYKTEDENGAKYESPLMTTLGELPDALAEEVRALLGAEMVVVADRARYGLGQYIFCPGTAEFVACTEATRGRTHEAEPGATPDRAAQ